MGSGLVVVFAPRLNDGACLGERSEPFHAQALVAKAAVEALVGAVLPGFAWVDERSLDTFARHPAQERARDELGTIVAAQVVRSATEAHEARQHLDDASRANSGADVDRQAFAGPFVVNGQTLQRASARERVEDEVDRPNVIRAVRRRRSWEVIAPDGRGVRFNADGAFGYFME